MFALPSPGTEQTKKSWGSAPWLLKLNVTVPVRTVLDEIAELDPVCSSTTTFTLDAGGGLIVTGFGAKNAVTCAALPEGTMQVGRVPRQAPVQFVEVRPGTGTGGDYDWPHGWTQRRDASAVHATDSPPLSVTFPFPAIVILNGATFAVRATALPAAARPRSARRAAT